MSTPRDSTVLGYPVEEDQQPKMPPATDSSSSSSSASLQHPGAAQLIPSLIPIQLTKENYLLWKSLFVSVLTASDMLDLAEGREQCPPQSQTLAHSNWIKRDQTLLTWINSSLPLSLLGQTIEFTSGRALWLHLEKLFAENATTRVLDLRDQLSNLVLNKFPEKKEYLKNAKEIGDALEEAGSPVPDSEFVCYVLNGLPDSYDDEFVASIRDRPEPLTREQLLKTLETHMHRSSEIVAIIYVLLFLPALFLCLVAISLEFSPVLFVLPAVLFVLLVLAMRWEERLSNSYTRRSVESMYMILHTEEDSAV